MPSPGKLRLVKLVRTDVLVERIASIIRVIRIGEPGTTLAVTSNRITHECHKIKYYSKSFRSLSLETPAALNAKFYTRIRQEQSSLVTVEVFVFTSTRLQTQSYVTSNDHLVTLCITHPCGAMARILLLIDNFASLSIIRIIKSRRMRWAGHVARMR
jgi:5-keto 4-deoxyuronate isomerase